MKKHFVVLASGLVLSALVLSGCGSGEAATEQTIQQSDNLAVEEQIGESLADTQLDASEKYVYEKRMDLEFSFGARSGIYTGEVNEDGIPNGNGTFVSENVSGSGWEYTGDWENGHWNGLGTSAWDSGQFYTGMYDDDVRTGFGVLYIDESQMMVTGYFDDSAPLGYCTIYMNDGSTFFGYFTEDWQALGEVYSPDGTSYSASYDGSQFTKIEVEPEEIIVDAPAAITWYGAGTYKIGVDLPAGEYCIKSTNTTPAYYCVSSDSQGDSILDNENFSGYYFVTVADGQYLQISRGKITESSNIADIADKSALESGMYRVGIDIPAGEYKLQNQNDKMGYFAVYDNSSINKDIIQNDNFEGSAYVTVSDGQYLYLTRCTGAIVE